jgi:hypothetical protein
MNQTIYLSLGESLPAHTTASTGQPKSSLRLETTSVRQVASPTPLRALQSRMFHHGKENFHPDGDNTEEC